MQQYTRREGGTSRDQLCLWPSPPPPPTTSPAQELVRASLAADHSCSRGCFLLLLSSRSQEESGALTLQVTPAPRSRSRSRSRLRRMLLRRSPSAARRLPATLQSKSLEQGLSAVCSVSVLRPEPLFPSLTKMSRQNAPEPLPPSEPNPSPPQPADPEFNQGTIELAKRIVEIGDKLYFEYLVRNLLSTISDTT
ncbi:uncharacterized protein LOC144456930 [Phascolarctos cinereus]